MRVLVTRPEPDASRQAAALAARGHEPVIAPLLTIEFLERVPLDLSGAQALIATSSNALRALGVHPERERALQIPLLAVGEATARAGQELGFQQVTIGPGTGAALAELIRRELAPGEGPLVHLAGEIVAFDLREALESQGFNVRRTVLYRAVPSKALPAPVLALLEAGKLHAVVLMSPRTAETFAGLVAHSDVGPLPICYCLSLAVAEAVVPLGFEVRVAKNPREEDVLVLLDSEAASLSRE